MAGLTFNLVDQLTFYGSYHTNKWNQLIHFIFVPAILWSLMVWLAYAGPVLPLSPDHLTFLPPEISRFVVINAPAIVAALYTLFYLCLEPFAGLTWSLFVGVPMWIAATAFQQLVPNAWMWALGVHIFSWYMQIHPGHAILEGRKPALLDSLVQAFALAPLFVWFELLFMSGYRPTLHKQLQQRISKHLAELRAQRQPLLADQDVTADK
eukprot:jgi/Chrzof1/7062/Cz02g09110.t1